MKERILFISRSIWLSLLLTLPLTVLASGNYVGGIPRVAGQKLDQEKLALGKLIYNGNLDRSHYIAGVPASASEQQAYLSIMHTQLPQQEQRKHPIVSLAGQLSPDHLEALHYFLTNRFKVQAPERIRLDSYFQGQQVFHGQTEGVTGAADAQRIELERLQQRLPRHVRQEVNLTSLAGRLSHEDLDALRYYIDLSYPKPVAK